MSDRELLTQHYWRLMNDGLARSTVTEFQDEMHALAKMSADMNAPRLAVTARLAEHRFDGSYRIVRAATK